MWKRDWRTFCHCVEDNPVCAIVSKAGLYGSLNYRHRMLGFILLFAPAAAILCVLSCCAYTQDLGSLQHVAWKQYTYTITISRYKSYLYGFEDIAGTSCAICLQDFSTEERVDWHSGICTALHISLFDGIYIRGTVHTGDDDQTHCGACLHKAMATCQANVTFANVSTDSKLMLGLNGVGFYGSLEYAYFSVPNSRSAALFNPNLTRWSANNTLEFAYEHIDYYTPYSALSQSGLAHVSSMYHQATRMCEHGGQVAMALGFTSIVLAILTVYLSLRHRASALTDTRCAKTFLVLSSLAAAVGNITFSLIFDDDCYKSLASAMRVLLEKSLTQDFVYESTLMPMYYFSPVAGLLFLILAIYQSCMPVPEVQQELSSKCR